MRPTPSVAWPSVPLLEGSVTASEISRRPWVSPSVTNKAKAQYYPNEGVVWRIRWNCGRQASVHGSQSHRRGDCRGSHVAARRHSISAGCCHSHDDDDDVDDSDPPSPPLPLKWRDLYTLARCRLQAPHKTKQSKDLLYQQINSTISSSTYH